MRKTTTTSRPAPRAATTEHSRTQTIEDLRAIYKAHAATLELIAALGRKLAVRR